VKLSKYFLKGISFGSIVTTICGCASMMASVQYPKPTLLSVSNGQVKIAGETKSDVTKIFNSYCSGGKQIKSLSLNLTYVEPKIPSGWAVNSAGSYLKEINQGHQCQSQRIIYSLAVPPSCDQGERMRGKSVCSHNDDQLWFFKSDSSSSEIEKKVRELSPADEYSSYSPVVVRNKDGKLLWFNYFEKGSNAPDLTQVNLSELLGDGVGSAYLSDLYALFNEFTILEPLEFQKVSYIDEIKKSNENGSCNLEEEYGAESVSVFKNGQHENVEAFGIDEHGNIDVSAAINQKHRIWRRYVSRFSQVKESSNPASAQINKTQVSLDLNAFCRYGRSIQDLTSK
jgi:hypothetical protein